MNFIQIIDVFTFYGIDVLLLAFLTAGLTQLIKRLIFKRLQKKTVTLLPFVIGTLLYAVYACVRNLSFMYLIEEYATIIEHGVSVGAVATVYYVLYEQFIRQKKGSSTAEEIIKSLIEGYLPEDKLGAAAKDIALALSLDATGNGAARTEEILKEYSDGKITEQNAKLLSGLIIEALAHISIKP